MGRWQKTTEKAVSTPKRLRDHALIMSSGVENVKKLNSTWFIVPCEQSENTHGSVWTEHPVKFFRRVENSLGTMWRQL